MEKIETFENIPFEEQKKYGILNAFALTVLMLIKEPRVFFTKMHINKGLKLPLVFMLIMVTFSVFVNNIYISSKITESPANQILELMQNDPELQEKADELRESMNREATVFDLFYNIFVNFVFLIIIAYFWNFVMKTLNIALNGLEATVRVFSYSTIVLITTLIPLNGPLMNIGVYIWWMYLMYIGISEAHEVSGRVAFRGIIMSLLASLIPIMFIFLAVF